MSKRNHAAAREAQLRQAIIAEAARLMAVDGIRDFALAKRKAVEHLGAGRLRHLPGNAEIEQALAEYQRLFHATHQPERLRTLRRAAVDAMQLLERFRPRLVGPVLRGTADGDAPVNLHLFADPPEAVAHFLMDQQIPFESDERLLRFTPERSVACPLFRFVAGDVVLELTLFPYDGLRQAPLSPVDGRPMRRASLDQVRALLDDDAESAHR